MPIKSEFVLTGTDRTQQLFNNVDKRLTGIQKHIQSIARVGTILPALVTGAGLRTLADYSDRMQGLHDRIGLVTNSTSELNRVQESLFDIAQKTRSPLTTTSELYARMAIGTKELGVSQSDLLRIVDLTNKSMKISGATTIEASAATLQLSQALAAGRLNGDEFRSLMETSPRLMQAVAAGMELPVGALKELSRQGKLTTDVIINSLKSQGEAIDKEFGSIAPKIGDAMTLAKNVFLSRLDEFNVENNLTDKIVTALGSVGTALLAFVDEFSTIKTATDLLIDDFSGLTAGVNTLSVAFLGVIPDLSGISSVFADFSTRLPVVATTIAGVTVAAALLTGGVRLLYATIRAHPFIFITSILGTLSLKLVENEQRWESVKTTVVSAWEVIKGSTQKGVLNVQKFFLDMAFAAETAWIKIKALFSAGMDAVNILVGKGVDSIIIKFASLADSVAESLGFLSVVGIEVDKVGESIRKLAIHEEIARSSAELTKSAYDAQIKTLAGLKDQADQAFTAQIDGINKTIDASVNQASQMAQTADQLKNDSIELKSKFEDLNNVITAGTDKSSDSIKKLGGAIPPTAAELKKSAAEARKFRDSVNDLLNELDPARKRTQEYEESLLKLEIALDKNLFPADELKRKIVELTDAYSELNPELQSTLDKYFPAQRAAREYAREIDNLTSLLSIGEITQEQFNEAVEKAGEAFDKASEGVSVFSQAWQDVENILSDTFVSILSGFDSFSDAFKNAAKRFAASIVRIFADDLAKNVANILKDLFSGKGFNIGDLFGGDGVFGTIGDIFSGGDGFDFSDIISLGKKAKEILSGLGKSAEQVSTGIQTYANSLNQAANTASNFTGVIQGAEIATSLYGGAVGTTVTNTGAYIAGTNAAVGATSAFGSSVVGLGSSLGSTTGATFALGEGVGGLSAAAGAGAAELGGLTVAAEGAAAGTTTLGASLSAAGPYAIAAAAAIGLISSVLSGQRLGYKQFVRDFDASLKALDDGTNRIKQIGAGLEALNNVNIDGSFFIRGNEIADQFDKVTEGIGGAHIALEGFSWPREQDN